MVVEADPSGGDLAARFRLSSRDGWPSFLASARRTGADVTLEPHLQQLPGGLDVLVGTRGLEYDEATGSMHSLLSCADTQQDGGRDALVDLGRAIPGELTNWVEHADRVVICTRGDAASLVQVRDKAPTILDRCHGEAWLAVVGKGSYARAEVEEFTGLTVIGVCPWDREAAAAAAGERGGRRRLHRSSLVSATTTMTSILVGESMSSGGYALTSPSGAESEATARATSTWAFHRSKISRSMRKARGRKPRTLTVPPSPEEALG